jgi:glyoxylase I family protein
MRYFPRMETLGVHHLAVKVTDLARAESFYVGVLGLPVLRRWPLAAGVGDRSLWLDLGAGVFLALERAESGADKSETAAGLHLVALRIPRSERDAWAAKLAHAGHAVYQRTDYTIYVRDPEGNRIGLSHWPDKA